MSNAHFYFITALVQVAAFAGIAGIYWGMPNKQPGFFLAALAVVGLGAGLLIGQAWRVMG